MIKNHLKRMASSANAAWPVKGSLGTQNRRQSFLCHQTGTGKPCRIPRALCNSHSFSIVPLMNCFAIAA